MPAPAPEQTLSETAAPTSGTHPRSRWSAAALAVVLGILAGLFGTVLHLQLSWLGGILLPWGALLALILGAVLLWGYLWTQTQYYVGEDQGRVAVFKGVPQTLGPVELSRVDRTTDVPLDRLPAYAQDRVRQGMPARDLGHADQIVGELQETAGAPVDGGGTP